MWKIFEIPFHFDFIQRLFQNLPSLHFANPVHILRLQYTSPRLALFHDPPPFRCSLLHIRAAGPGEGHVRGGVTVALIRHPRLLPAPHHFIVPLVVHFVEAGMMTAAITVKGGGSFERMHHETKASACAHNRDSLRAWTSWRDIGHLQTENQSLNCYWISNEKVSYLGPDVHGLGLAGRVVGLHDGIDW